MPMLDANSQPAAGFNRITLAIANLQYLSTGASIGSIDTNDGTLWFVGRVSTTVGNATTYSYNILYSIPATALLRDQARNIYADVPNYIAPKSPDLLYVLAPPSEDADNVTSKLPANIKV